MTNNILFKNCSFSMFVFITIISLFLLWEHTTMAEKETEVKEAKMDFIYVYGDEDSAIFRITITKSAEGTRIERMECPLQQKLFRDGRWEYKKGEIPIEQTEKIFKEASTSRFNSLKSFYAWEGSTAHHPALLRVRFLLGDNTEFTKEIRIEDYPLGVPKTPILLKEILEITKLLQDQTMYASEKLSGGLGKTELEHNITEINMTTDKELKYFSSLALDMFKN